jgi:hypothetical protein
MYGRTGFADERRSLTSDDTAGIRWIYPAAATHILTVTKTGQGTVTSNPTGINCGTDCSKSYASATLVTLTATPSAGNTFAGWSGDCTGSSTCVVSMTAAKNVTATFNIMPQIFLGEALDNTTLAWATSGNASWYGQTLVTHDGVDAAQSGLIRDSQLSDLNTVATGPGTLTFFWKVSSEANYDFLTFKVDGAQQFSISGLVDWQQKTVAIPSGQHTVTWSYTKDGSVSVNADAGWVDQVVYGSTKANQTIVFGSAPVVSVGSTGTVLATGGASGNPVTFTSTTVGVCTVAGSAVTGLAAGTCTIAADQAGNANYNPAPQTAQAFPVNKANQAISFGPAPTVVVGGTGRVSATGGGSGNSVVFSSQTIAVCTVSGTTVTGVAAGTCTLYANQAGNANYNAAPQATQTFSIANASGFALTVSNANSAGGSIVSDVGGIVCGTNCTGSFSTGAAVKLTVLPLDGYQFSGWGGDCAVCRYGNVCTVTMNAAKSCSASFEPFVKHSPLWKRMLLSQ